MTADFFRAINATDFRDFGVEAQWFQMTVASQGRHSRESGNPSRSCAKGKNGLTSFAVVERFRFRGNDGPEECSAG